MSQVNPSAQNITQYNIQTGDANNNLHNVAPSATSGVPVISQGAASQPIFGTAVVAGGGTGAVTLTGVLTGNGTSAITGNAVTQHGVLIGGASNVVDSLGVASTGTVLAGNTGADPSFQSLATVGAITTITGDTGGAESPSAGNFNILGSGSITVAGSANTETVQLTGLTNHNVLVGAGTTTITKVAPSATSGIPLVSNGSSADPSFTTAVVAGGGTGAVTLTAHGVLLGQGTSAVTAVAPGSTGQVLQANSSADPTYSTATYPSTATSAGKILRADGTNWAQSTATYPDTAGTSGNVLTSDGTNWNSTSPSSGSLVLISTKTASSSASITFTSNVSSYNNLMLIFDNVLPVNNGDFLYLQISTNGGSSYTSSGYTSGSNRYKYNGASWFNDQTTAAILLGGQINSSNIPINGSVTLFNTTNGSYMNASGQSTLYDSIDSIFVICVFGGTLSVTGINAIQIICSTGNIAQGSFSLYGIKS